MRIAYLVMMVFFATAVFADVPPPPLPENVTCTEFWRCSEWSECSSGYQLRTCKDINYCGTRNNIPEEAQRCGDNVNESGGTGEEAEVPSAKKEESPLKKNLILGASMAAGVGALVGLFFLFKYLRYKKDVKSFEEAYKTSTKTTPLEKGFGEPYKAITETAPIEISPEIDSYIRNALAAGYSKEQVKNKLLSSGWDAGTADNVLRNY